MGKQENQQEQGNFICSFCLAIRFICLSLRCGYKALDMKLDKYSITQSSKSIETLAKEFSQYAESYGEEVGQIYWKETDSAVASKMDLKAYAKSRMISFVSNDYLGLSQHPQVQSDAIRAINQFGTGFCAAPSIGGYSSFQKRLEEGLSKLLHTEDTLLSVVKLTMTYLYESGLWV